MAYRIRARRLRAPLVVTVATSVLAAHCGSASISSDASPDGSAPMDGAASVPDAVVFDAPACPPPSTLPVNLACAVNGQMCQMRVDGQWCPESFSVYWYCEGNVWRDHGSWSCNPPRLTPDVPTDSLLEAGPVITDVVRVPSPDRAGVCPAVRPTEGTSCEPADVPERCAYTALDAVCPAERTDVATCPYPSGRWRIELASCRRSPCPATPPPDGLPCDFPARDDCDYTISCEGEPAQVRAYCLMSGEWTTRSLCRSWFGRDGGVWRDT